MKVIYFKIEPSKLNKGRFLLIAVTEDNSEWVVSGDAYDCRYIIPKEQQFDIVEGEQP